MSDLFSSASGPSDRDLLRLIYRHLDWLGVVENCPGLTTKRIEDFFKRMELLLSEEPAHRTESKPADAAKPPLAVHGQAPLDRARSKQGPAPTTKRRRGTASAREEPCGTAGLGCGENARPAVGESDVAGKSDVAQPPPGLSLSNGSAVGDSSAIKVLTLYVDGGSRGNPGPAGCGAALLDSSGNVVEEMDRFLGRATNNEAEYQALIMGLKGARARGVEEITIRADSQLMVRQINGEYKVKSPNLKPLFNEVKSLLSGFSTWRAEHVRREQNTLADALANRAMDRGRS